MPLLIGSHDFSSGPIEPAISAISDLPIIPVADDSTMPMGAGTAVAIATQREMLMRRQSFSEPVLLGTVIERFANGIHYRPYGCRLNLNKIQIFTVT